MRRISQQELDGLRNDLDRRAQLARGLAAAKIGGGDDFLAIAYLVAEVDYLENVIREYTGVAASLLIARPHVSEVARSSWPPLNVRPER